VCVCARAQSWLSWRRECSRLCVARCSAPRPRSRCSRWSPFVRSSRGCC
jgi:hypothetical protein